MGTINLVKNKFTKQFSRSFFVTLAVLFMLVGCGGGGGGDGGGGGNGGGFNTNSKPGSSANLIGTWLLSCQTSFTTSLVVDDTNYVATTSVYSDPACTAGTEYYTEVYSSTYSIGSLFTSDNGLAATQLNVEMVSIERTLHDAFWVQSYNAKSTCGYSDWALGVAKDITGRDCGTDVASCTSHGGSVCDAAGLVTYTSYGVDDSDTQLMFGYPTTGKDGTTAQKRMTNLLTIVFFNKQ